MAVVTAQVTSVVNIGYTVNTGLSPYTIPIYVPGGAANLGSPSNPWALAYTNGTGALQVDSVYAVNCTLNNTTSTINLQSLIDPDGLAVNFARVREFMVFNLDTTNTHAVKVYSAATNGVTFLPPNTSPLVCAYNNGFIRISDPYSTNNTQGNVVNSVAQGVTFSTTALVSFGVVALGGTVA